MKIPLVFTARRPILAAIAMTLLLVASPLQAQRAHADESDSKPTAPANAVELEVLEHRNASFERNLDADLGSKLDALADDVSRANLSELAPVHDARLSDRVDAHIEGSRADLPPAVVSEGAILAGDRSPGVVSVPVAYDPTPAAPAR